MRARFPGPTRDDGNPARELQQLVERGARSVADAGHGTAFIPHGTAPTQLVISASLCIELRAGSPSERIFAPARASGQSGMEKEVAVDDLGERSHDALPAGPTPDESGQSRREFLKKAAGVALALPAAGALAGSAVAAPRIRVASRAKPFEGVTLQFAKAPFGNDEKDVIAKLLALRGQDGAKIVHTVVPWNVEGATYATNYAGRTCSTSATRRAPT